MPYLSSLTTLLSLVLATTHAWGQGEPIPVTPENLAKWDLLFVPGRYRVVEYEVDAKGAPSESSKKSKEVCLDAEQLRQISRLPALAAVMWKCSAPQFQLSAVMLSAGMGCAPLKPDEPFKIGTATVYKTGESSFESRLQIIAPKTDEHPEAKSLYSVGSTLTRVGVCK